MSDKNAQASTNNSAVPITSVDRVDDLQDVITALSEALGGTRCLHTVGGVHGAIVDRVVVDPESAFDTIVSAVEADRTASEGAAILTGSGNLDSDLRIAAVAGAGVIVVTGGEGCHTEAAKTRVRLALSSAAQRHSEVLAVVLTGEEAAEVARTLELDVPVVVVDDAEELRKVVSRKVTAVVTPQHFQWWLLQRTKADKRHIVLPEGDDDRILETVDYLLREDICELIILGAPDAMEARAAELGFDIDTAHLWNPQTSEYVERFAEQLAEMRKAKGITLEQARETMQDISYFATMMIHNGLVDGTVSGAAHTTAHIIRPLLRTIKTEPSASTVLSLFLMVMDNSLWGFADCAVLPKPAPEQLGEIAVASAETVASFGIDARVAMLSYSTGTPGTGEDVDRVRAGLAKAKELAPDLAVDGPLQFDVAIDPSVAAKKMPDSPVAGKATVFVLPGLDTGDIGYKIAQRCGGALAVGPVLQGLNKPVNDLSHDATMSDIINTVAITAIQAGGD